MPFDANSPESKTLISDALAGLREGLEDVKKALKNSEKSSARWAQPGRELAGLHKESLTAAMKVTDCSIENLTDFSCANHAFFEAGKKYLTGDDSLMNTQSIVELITKGQEFQNSSAEAREKTNSIIQDPAHIGISADSIKNPDPFGIDKEANPHQNVTIAAAVGIETELGKLDVTGLDLNNPTAAPAA
jgi:hypothetical protein